MTKRELEIAIPIVIGEVIEKCLHMLARVEGEEREKILQIARNAELLQTELSNEINKVKKNGFKSMENPKVLMIMKTLNEKTMDFHEQLNVATIVKPKFSFN
jgi:hypothetical protein